MCIRDRAIADLLLGQGQIHRIFGCARNLGELRASIYIQLKRAVLSRRQKTVSDRLIRRIEKLEDEGLIKKITFGTITAYQRGRAFFVEHQTHPMTDVLSEDDFDLGDLVGDGVMAEVMEPRTDVIASLSQAQISQCVRKLQSMPILLSRIDSSRETKVFTNEALREFLRCLLYTSPSPRD